MNFRKSQNISNILFSIPLIKKDGSQATGETTGLFTKIITPAGAALTGYTEATFTEPNSDGVYVCIFPTTAGNKAFISVDQANPYTITLDSTTADVEPTTIYAWVVSLYPWEVPVLTADAVWDEPRAEALLTQTQSISGDTTLLKSTSQTILDDTNEIQSKLPTGTISDFNNSTQTVLISGGINTLDELLLSLNGQGNNLVTINVQDISTLLPIPDTFIKITDSTSSQPLAKGYTNSLGNYSATLDNGNYNVFLRKSFVNFPSPETLTVSGSGTFTFSGSGFSPTAPTTVDSCMVYGYVVDVGGTVVKNATITATESSSNRFYGNSKVVKTTKSVKSDNNGYFEISLLHSSKLSPSGLKTKITITYPGLNYSVDIVVPEIDSAEFSTLV